MRIRLIVFLILLALCVVPSQAAKKNYTYYRLGGSDIVFAGTKPGTVLMGGGTDVDAAFEWMCDQAGGGDFLVIRTTGTDAYNPYIRELCTGMNSVATLIVPSAAGANDPFVVNAIQSAEAIWIAGGDQSTYVTNWNGTLLQDAVNDKAGSVPVGGTSAGMMVLTQFIYSALGSQGVTSSQALADPYNRYVTLASDLFDIGGLRGTISDSHFVTRDRMGRTLAFMARVAAEGWDMTPRAIAVDEETALRIADGRASVVGNGAAYFLSAAGPAEVCRAKRPLTYRNVSVHRIEANESFNLSNWTGTGVFAYTVSAEAGVLSSTQPDGSIY